MQEVRRDVAKDTTSKMFDFVGAGKGGTVSTRKIRRLIKLMSEHDKDEGNAVANELLVELGKDPDGSAELGQIETIFIQLGEDGVVSNEGMSRLLRRMTEADGGNTLVQMLLAELDKNPDDTFSIEEFREMFTQVGDGGGSSNRQMMDYVRSMFADISQLFSLFDKNENRTANNREICHLVRRLPGYDQGDGGAAVKKLLFELEKTADNVLSIQQFRDLFEQHDADDAVSEGGEASIVARDERERAEIVRNVDRESSALFKAVSPRNKKAVSPRHLSRYVQQIPDSPDIESKAVVKELLAALDKDPDGSLSLEEFQKLFRELSENDTAKKDRIERFVQQRSAPQNSNVNILAKAFLLGLHDGREDSTSFRDMKNLFHEVAAQNSSDDDKSTVDSLAKALVLGLEACPGSTISLTDFNKMFNEVILHTDSQFRKCDSSHTTVESMAVLLSLLFEAAVMVFY